MVTISCRERNGVAAEAAAWRYEEAFARNLGLLTAAEQERLRLSRVAIAGLGGVGGIHLVTLARLGIGAFHIADPDQFELANFNRQIGASVTTLGQPKAEIMAEMARAVNPDLGLNVFAEPVTETNVAAFLEGIDVVVDGIDAFALEARRLLCREARRRGIWVVAAGPLGFSTAWLLFSPTGMSFDDYFDLHDDMSPLERMVAYAVGIAPAATHRGRLSLADVDFTLGRGPSLGLACQLCAGVAATEVLKILLGKGDVRPVPHYAQCDAYRGICRTGKLRGGNRHPWQRLKRWWLSRQLRCLGWDDQLQRRPNY
jgi:molybdopterin/thiamine biosynthesis adenylyltransferase